MPSRKVKIEARAVPLTRHIMPGKQTEGKPDVKIGNAKSEIGDARHLNLEDNSPDTVITSHPYSFAIDCAGNDRPKLEYLGFKNLRELIPKREEPIWIDLPLNKLFESWKERWAIQRAERMPEGTNFLRKQKN